MSVWQKYTKKQQDEYIKFLTVYGALSNLFRQKQGEPIPYLDSKFQETIYAKVFQSKNVDIGNTPHDILSVFGSKRIGIGLKTWMNSTPSYQKVMQLKRYKDDIMKVVNNPEELVYMVSSIKNSRMESDYKRLGLNQNSNIYHYVTRDTCSLQIQECAYPLVDIEKITDIKNYHTSVTWSDGQKKYKFTIGDSQIWQYFDSSDSDSTILNKVKVDIIDNPFDLLIDAYDNRPTKISLAKRINVITSHIAENAIPSIESNIDSNEKIEYDEIYLPLYSYATKQVQEKSGLNAWNAAPKNPQNPILRPLNEIYIPIPRELHKKVPDFFVQNIFQFEEKQLECSGLGITKPEIRFKLVLPNGKEIPAIVTQDNHKALQSGSRTEINPETGQFYGQSALGQWLLVDVLGLNRRVLVTRDWLIKKDVDSVRLWHKKGDYNRFFIDIAPVNSFERFMDDVGEIDIENSDL